MKALISLCLLLSTANPVEYFPSILFGHILVGPGVSRYETVFTITARQETRSTLSLFTDAGEPMKASFIDEQGKAASTSHSFEFFLMPDRPVKIRLGLPSDEASDDVAVKSGWATFRSTGEIQVTALVRITTPDGKLVTRHVLGSEKPPAGD